MNRTTIYLEKDDVVLVRSSGYTLSGFVRFQISKLKKNADLPKSAKCRTNQVAKQEVVS